VREEGPQRDMRGTRCYVLVVMDRRAQCEGGMV
jgi:hypothetical protein